MAEKKGSEGHDGNGPRGRVGAVVLAAGASRRMGRVKSLLPLGGRAMIVRVVEALTEAGGIGTVVVVTGHEGDAVAAAVAACNIERVQNAAWDGGGMLSSVRCGMAALAGRTEAMMVVLGDQPAVRAETVRELVRRWQGCDAAIVLPTFEGRRGHPVIFSATLWREIDGLSAGETLRDVVHRHADKTLMVAVDDEAVTADVDTPEEYRAAAARWEQT